MVDFMGSENGKARFCVSYGDSEITDSRDVNWDSLEMSFVFHGPFFNCFLSTFSPFLSELISIQFLNYF